MKLESGSRQHSSASFPTRFWSVLGQQHLTVFAVQDTARDCFWKCSLTLRLIDPLRALAPESYHSYDRVAKPCIRFTSTCDVVIRLKHMQILQLVQMWFVIRMKII